MLLQFTSPASKMKMDIVLYMHTQKHIKTSLIWNKIRSNKVFATPIGRRLVLLHKQYLPNNYGTLNALTMVGMIKTFSVSLLVAFLSSEEEIATHCCTSDTSQKYITITEGYE